MCHEEPQLSLRRRKRSGARLRAENFIRGNKQRRDISLFEKRNVIESTYY